MSDAASWTSSPLLFGRDQRLTRRFILIAGWIAAVFGGGPLFLDWLAVSVSSARLFQLLFVVTLAAAAINAYANDGLLVSWVLAAAGLLPLGLAFSLTNDPIGTGPTLLSSLGTLAGATGLYGTLVGTAGFVIGAGARRIVVRRRSGRPDS